MLIIIEMNMHVNFSQCSFSPQICAGGLSFVSIVLSHWPSLSFKKGKTFFKQDTGAISSKGLAPFAIAVKLIKYLGAMASYDFDLLGSFWAHFDLFGLFQTLFLLKSISAKRHFVSLRRQINFCLKGPKGCTKAENGPKWSKKCHINHLGFFWTTCGHWQVCHVWPFLVPNGPLWMPCAHHWRMAMAETASTQLRICLREGVKKNRLFLGKSPKLLVGGGSRVLNLWKCENTRFLRNFCGRYFRYVSPKP